MLQLIRENKINRLLKNYVENETPFQIQEILGKGSYGVAYLLIHKDTGVQYVLKRLRAKHRKDERQLLKFRQEISMLKQLDIPNVPNVYLEGDLEEIPFYIMEFYRWSYF